jgi:23S rRNA pseudouridine1911/1915/1917 synthase
MPPNLDIVAGPRECGRRLDAFLAGKAGSLTRSQIKKLIGQDRVRVNGRSGKPGYKLRPGDRVEVEWMEEENRRLGPEPLKLNIIYADEHLIVVNKPSGLTVHPGAGRWAGTLAGGLLARFPEVAQIGPQERPGIVHRLDKETSGVMVVARSPEAYARLQRMFKNREVHKTYLGLAWGKFAQKEGRIAWAIGRHTRDGQRFTVRGRKPREALTLYKVLKEYKDFSLVEIRPVTGRTHQIRVHFAAAGHPLAGDLRYGHRRPRMNIPRLFLHAHKLAFQHPVGGQPVEFTAPLPSELEEILGRLAD